MECIKAKGLEKEEGTDLERLEEHTSQAVT